MKQLFILFSIVSFLSFSLTTKAQSSCAYTHSVSGYTATFNHMWPLAMIYVLDSIHINYGDGNSQYFYAPVPSTSNYTYTTPGTYMACLTRYIHDISSPTVPIICTFCDSVTIAGTSTGCSIAAAYSVSTAGLTANFTNTTSCIGCVSTTYTWVWGDGTPNGTGTSPSHTYSMAGTYNVCLIANATGTGSTCMDSFCTSITVSTSTPCTNAPNFNVSISSGSVANFTNLSTITPCSSISYSWNFGDGSPLSTAMNPTHTYAATGIYNVCLTVGCDDSSSVCPDSTYCKSVTVSVLSSLNEFNQYEKLNIHPNPSKGLVTIDFPSLETNKIIKIYELTGREVLKQHLSSKATKADIDISHLSNGCYFVNVFSDNKTYYGKITKQ